MPLVRIIAIALGLAYGAVLFDMARVENNISLARRYFSFSVLALAVAGWGIVG